MSPQEIQDAYAVVVQDIQNQTAQEAARIGNSQRSLGTLAERVASPSGQTSGLANYTYDRTMRPVVDSLTTSLTTSGKAAALENLLKTKLREAKSNYENAKNSYTAGSGGGGNGGSGGGSDGYNEATDDTTYWGGPVNQYNWFGTGAHAAFDYVARQNANKDMMNAVYETLKGQYERGEITQEEWERAQERMYKELMGQ